MAVSEGEFGDEVSHHLPFYGCSRVVLYVKLAKLHCPQSPIAHKAILPATSGLLMALLKGLSVKTTMVCAWKYGLSFRVAVINTKANFSI